MLYQTQENTFETVFTVDVEVEKKVELSTALNAFGEM